MTLIKSISGIRGTIGGRPGDGLTPVDIVKYTAAYGSWIIKRKTNNEKPVIAIGRDARISGEMVQNLVAGTLKGYTSDKMTDEILRMVKGSYKGYAITYVDEAEIVKVPRTTAYIVHLQGNEDLKVVSFISTPVV